MPRSIVRLALECTIVSNTLLGAFLAYAVTGSGAGHDSPAAGFFIPMATLLGGVVGMATSLCILNPTREALRKREERREERREEMQAGPTLY